MITQELLNKYLESKVLSWAPSTLRSEKVRLAAALTALNELTPTQYYQKLVSEGLKPYTIKTIFIRLRKFLLEINELEKYKSYNDFMSSHQRLFKYAYTKERVKITFEEALKRIDKIPSVTAKAKALQLLYSGMRFSESKTLDENNEIVGKGGKRRAVYGVIERFNGSGAELSYSGLYASLKKVGLKPHTLRKLAAQRLVQLGASSMDLMEVMGWSSINTATSYLQNENNKGRLESLMKRF